MTKPSNFIIHSGYASLKNDANDSMTLVIPNGYFVAPNSEGVISVTKDIGSKAGSLRTRMRLNGSSNWQVGSSIQLNHNVNIATIGVVSNPTSVNIRRISATTVQIYCVIENTSPFNMTVSGTQTIEARVNSFLSPF